MTAMDIPCSRSRMPTSAAAFGLMLTGIWVALLGFAFGFFGAGSVFISPAIVIFGGAIPRAGIRGADAVPPGPPPPPPAP